MLQLQRKHVEENRIKYGGTKCRDAPQFHIRPFILDCLSFLVGFQVTFFGVLVKWIYGKLKSDKQRRFYTIIISGLIFILINWNSYQALYEFLPIAGLVRVFFGIGFLFGFVIGVFKPKFFIDP